MIIIINLISICRCNDIFRIKILISDRVRECIVKSAIIINYIIGETFKLYESYSFENELLYIDLYSFIKVTPTVVKKNGIYFTISSINI